MRATPGQIKRIHALLPSAIKDDHELKGDLVAQFSKDGNRSTKELEVMEANSLIRHLEQQPDDRDKMRKKILSICHDLQWYIPGTTNLDWKRIGDFCMKRGNAHKRNLNAHTRKELVILVSQFEQVQFAYYQKAAKNATTKDSD